MAKEKTVHIALDDLDYGSVESPEAYGRVKKATLPEGITRGRLFRDVLLLSGPSLVELLLTQLTGMADQIMVGRMAGNAGVQGLSAVGLATLPRFILLTMIIAMNVGTTAVIARSRGQQNRERANNAFMQAIVLNLILSALMMVLGLSISRWLITFMGASGITQETLEMGITYLNIQLYGFIPICLTATITAALRGVGDTRTPMIYNTVANVVNVIFNYLLIYGKLGFPELGVAGASLATVIGQTVAFVMAMAVAMGRRHYVYLEIKKRFRFDKEIISNITRIGLPSMVEQLIMRMGFLIFNRSVASLGDTLMATHQVLVNIQGMSFMLGQASGSAATTLMGQSLGKRRYDMAALYMRETRRLGLIASMILLGLMALFNEELIMLYNSTPEVVAAGAGILLVIGFMQPLQGDQFIVSGGLRGVGDTRYSAVVTFITTLLIRGAMGVIAINVLGWGLIGAWIVIFSDQLIRTVMMNARYYLGAWKKNVRRFTERETAKAA